MDLSLILSATLSFGFGRTVDMPRAIIPLLSAFGTRALRPVFVMCSPSFIMLSLAPHSFHLSPSSILHFFHSEDNTGSTHAIEPAGTMSVFRKKEERNGRKLGEPAPVAHGCSRFKVASNWMEIPKSPTPARRGNMPYTVSTMFILYLPNP
ncbi:unnamed protein product [Tuber aestivum]|uniref:Uncharacterized protein n=1 Tax=Tuber aestivum TaxID=59557 RepID=A0A292PJM3_9PEZI|nr:unnamed protein product [Tuber aestivum]